MTLLAVRLIDLAIFGTMGSLWLGGALFIVVLYRWIVRYERGDNTSVPPMSRPVEVAQGRSPSRGAEVPMSQPAAARTFDSSEPALT